jgi:hypothetical protein
MKRKFSWKKFHQDLDLASAIMIEEQSRAGKPYLPSKVSLLQFIEYSHQKTQEHNDKRPNKKV